LRKGNVVFDRPVQWGDAPRAWRVQAGKGEGGKVGIGVDIGVPGASGARLGHLSVVSCSAGVRPAPLRRA